MASPSSSSSGGYTRKTRFQDETQKRSAEEQLKQDAELKRQKKMFAPRKLIGPLDLLVNSNLPKIKLEEDVGSSSSVKLEPLVSESMAIERNDHFLNCNVPTINPELDVSLLVKMEETTEVGPTFTEQLSEQDESIQYHENLVHEIDVKHEVFSEIEKSGNASKTTLKPEGSTTLCQNHIKKLKVLIGQKDQEINLLFQAIQGLQRQLLESDHMLSKMELNNEQLVLVDSNINKGSVIQGAGSHGTRAVAKLTSDLMERNAKVVILSMKMLKLQDKIFGTASFKLEISKNYKTSAEFLQESFEMILPFLYTDLQLNDTLACRMVCRSWRDATDTFLTNHPTKMPFEKETHLKELGKLEHGRTPIWNESPLQKLAKGYVFSNVESLKAFTDEKRGTIIGSLVCLDNLILKTRWIMTKTGQFLNRFDTTIKFMIIRQWIDLPDFKIHLLMDRVKLCLSKLPNLQHFKLVFCIDKEKTEREDGWDALQAKGNKTYGNWGPSNFPQLDKLESLELQLENWERFTEHANFLENFSISLVKPYSEQLKRFSTFTPGFDPSDCSVFPNLVQLSIPQSEQNSLEFICQHVEKLTITSYSTGVVNMFHIILKTFPKLLCLGFKFECVGEEFNDFLPVACSGPRSYTPSFTKLPNILTLELENCGMVTFEMLECFPNLCYLKLINEHTDRIEEYQLDEPVLEITNLWKGEELYELSEFWEHFPKLSLVTLEYKGEAMTNREPKLFKWNRKGFANYYC